MSEKALAAVLERPGEMRVREFELPEIGEDDGLLRVELAGVCGSDPKHFYDRMHGKTVYPIILGHEIVGHIAELGPTAAARWGVKKGDHVVVDSFLGCGHCPRCLAGELRFCKKLGSYGTRTSSDVPPHLWGSYAQYMYLAPNAFVCKISDDLPGEAGVVIGAVLANGIRWARTLGTITVGDTVAILGVGQQGLAALIVARASGASRVVSIGITKDRARFEMARKLGADIVIDSQKEDPVARVREITGGDMADVVVDVSGAPAAALASLELVRPTGTIVNAGLNGDKQVPFQVDRIVWNEIRYIGAFSHDIKSFVGAIGLAESRKFPLEALVTHRYSLAEAEKAIRVVGGEFEEEDPIKVVLDPWR